MLKEVLQAGSEWPQTVIQFHMKKQRTPVKVAIKDSVNAYFFSFLLLADIKDNCIKQYLYNCVIGALP